MICANSSTSSASKQSACVIFILINCFLVAFSSFEIQEQNNNHSECSFPKYGVGVRISNCDHLGLIGLIHWTWEADHCVVLLSDKTKKSQGAS